MSHTACPITGQESSGFATRLDELEQTAQRLLDYPAAEPTEAAFTECQRLLENRYGLMHDYEPLRAEWMVWRGVRSAGTAALSQVINGKFFQTVTPILREREALVRDDFNASAREEDIFLTPKIAGTSYETYLRSGAAWVLQASIAVQRDIIANQEHPYRPLWEKLAEIQPKWGKARLAYQRSRGEEATYEPNVKLTDSLHGLALDNLDAAAKPLVISALSLSLRMRRQPTARELTQTALANIGRLGWPASMKRSANHRMLSTTWSKSFVSATSLEEMLTSEQGKIFRQALGDKGEYWARYGLRNGSWRRAAAGLCAGQIVTRNPDAEVRYLARKFFAEAGVDVSQVMTPMSGHDQVSVVLAFGARVAEETIYKTWPQHQRLLE